MKLNNTGKQLLLALALSTMASPRLMAASQPEDIRQLLVQGHYWVGQGHPDLAIAAWEKVLMTDPGNEEAQNALRELKDFHPSRIDQTKLALARKLARQHKYADALKMYKLAFAGGTPNSFYAAEYYETLSGTRGGWKPAIRALDELVRKYPSNDHYRLVRARVQTYHESTRRNGIATLAEMAGNDDLDETLRHEAAKAWKNALLWLPGIGADRGLYQRYLEAYPGDTEIENRLANLDRLGKHNTLQQAWGYLNSGELDKAEAIFTRLLRASPDNAEALAGLGLTRMKRQRFAGASEALEKALAIAPDTHRDLEPVLKEARFWANYKKAEQAWKQGRYRRALKALDQADALRPNSYEALRLRAAIAARRGNLRKASQLYDKALERRPDDPEARRGLLQLLIQSGDEAGALRLLRKHDLPQQAYREARNRLKAQRLWQQARNSEDPQAAITVLREALELDPGNAWMRLELARLLAARGERDEAAALFDGYLRSFPNDQEHLFAAAILLAELDRPEAALQRLRAIPPAYKNEAQLRLEQRLQARLQLARAKALIAKGDYRGATLIAETLAPSDDPQVRLIYAELLARLGEEKDALWQAQQAWKQVEEDTGATLQYATVLLLTHQYQALDELLLTLKHRPGLTAPDREAIARLRLGLELELADNLRKSGDYNAAWRQLLPFLPQHADDPSLRTLLASIYHDAGDSERALQLYRAELAQRPGNRAAWHGAVGAAMALRDYPLADELIARGLETHPDDPELLLQRARLHYLRGRRQAALDDLDQALVQARALPRSTRQRAAEQFPQPSPDDTAASARWALDARRLKARIDAETATTLTIGTSIHKRSGTTGVDELTTTTLPLEWRSTLNADKGWGIRITPTLLDAGAPDADVAHLLGSQAIQGAGVAGEDLDDEAVAVSLFYEGPRWEADIGLAGAGFLLDGVEGRLAWKQQDFASQSIIGAERRRLRASLLARAGLRDGLTGIDWGGVNRNAVTFDHYLRGGDDAPATIHGHASYALLEGEHVEDNGQLKLEGSVQWGLTDETALRARLGIRATYQHFDKNLRGFTLGQGGYFSPDHHLALSIPLEIDGTRGPFRYGLSVALGLQYFTEDDSPRFPLDPALQQALEAGGDSQLEGDAKSSFTTTLQAGFEYRLNREIGIGGVIASTNDNDYDATGIGLYLRYYFDRPAVTRHGQWWRDGKQLGLW